MQTTPLLRLIRATCSGLVALAALLAVGWLAWVPSATESPYVFVGAWGERGTGPGQFDDPTGVAVAGEEVFVADSRNDRIQVFDRDGRFRRTFGTPGKGPGQLGRPMNLAIHEGRVYVTEFFNDRIQIFDLDGTPLGMFGTSGSGPGQFDSPGGLAVADDGDLLVADVYNQRIQRVAPDGRFVRQWGTTRGTGVRAGRFNYPTDVAVGADGAIFVADGYNDRIQVFAPDGTFSHKWGGPFAVNIFGPFNGWFATVTSVAVDGAGRLFAADFYNHRIQKFSADGTFLTRFGTNGSGAGQFEHPIAAAVAGDGMVYVVDYGNSRVTRWRPSTQ